MDNKWLNELVSNYKKPDDNRRTGILNSNQVSRILNENKEPNRKTDGNSKK